MSRNLKRLCWRSCLFCVESLVVIAVVLAIALGVSTVALRAGAININFAKNYIQSSLHNPERGIHVDFDNAMLSWPQFDGPFMLGFENGRVSKIQDSGEASEIISIQNAELGVSKSGLLLGRVQPVSLIVSTLQFDVVRDNQGEIDLGFGDLNMNASADGETPKDIQPQEDQEAFLTRILDYIGTEDDGADSSPLAHLKLFHIKDAQIRFTDQESAFSMDFVNSDIKFESEEAGLKAQLDLTLFNENKAAAQEGRLMAEIHASRQMEKMAVSASTAGFDLGVLLPYLAEHEEITGILEQQDVVFDAKIQTVLGKNLMPEEIEYAVISDEGVLRLDYISDQPIGYENFQLAGIYHHDKGLFKISKGGFIAEGVGFDISTQIDRQEDGNYFGPVQVKIAELPQDKISSLWPQGLDEETAREWFVDKMSKGVFRDVETSLTLQVLKGEDGWDVDAKDILARLTMDGMDVDYRSPLPAVVNAQASAEFSYDKETLVIGVQSGTIGNLKVEEAEIKFRDIIQEGKGFADIHVDLSGALSDMFRYIEKEPIGVEHKFDVKEIKGSGALSVHVGIPTQDDVLMSQVKINVEGEVKDVTLPNVVEGLALSGGPFKISVDSTRAQVSGKGQLAKRPIDVTWMEYLNSKGRKLTGKVTANITADQKLREHFGIDLSDFMTGDAKLALSYMEYAGNRSVADVLVDMSPAKFFVEPFGYVKPRNKVGRASFKAILQDNMLQEVDDLAVTTDHVSLRDARLVFRSAGKDTKLAKGRLGAVKIHETDAAIDFEIDENDKTKIWLKGKFLDLRPFLEGDEKEIAADEYDKPPMVLSVQADEMRTADDAVIRDGKIFADINGQGKFNQLELDAVAGAGDIYLRFKPDSTGARTFRFEADDAGATLRAFDIYQNIRGGKMVFYGEPINGVYDRNLVGLAEITDFRVVKAPGLAKLLGAMSLPGVTQLLNNEGIVFSKLESNFDWVNKANGSVLVLKNGRTSGNSLGLTFDGIFDREANKVDVSGTIIPLSTLNKMLGGIPVLGDILGGTGGLFAATYTIKGEGDDPEIKINPLSVLAPGIFRRILFE